MANKGGSMRKYLAILVAVAMVASFAPLVFAGGETDTMTATTEFKVLETGVTPTYYVTIGAGDLTGANTDLTLPVGLPGSIAFLKVSTGGVMTYDTATYLTAEADTLDSVTGRGAITANAVTTGAFTSGADGADGQLTIYSEQGATDYSVVFQPNVAMTQTTTYVWPADDGTASQVLQTDGAGALTWASAAAGDITSVGDVASGAAFDGTQGTVLTFYNVGGNATLTYDGTTITNSKATAATTLDTGQGANELFDMDQNVLAASAVTFATVDTGQGANELYDMDQNVLQASDVTFNSLTTTTDIIASSTSNIYLGATAVDGTWRIVRSGSDLVFQVRETGTYNTKFTMQP